MRNFSALFVFLVSFGSIFGGTIKTELASGTVFLDSNRNGTMDQDEKGIGDILVSNGVEIVKTNANGNYKLDLNPNGNLFVIKPSGYMTPVSHLELPKFYFLHRTTDSTSKVYPGLSATGPLPEQINFPLYIQEESSTFNVLIFGDTQPKNVTHVDYLSRDIVDELVGIEEAAFGVTLGDVVDDDLTLFDPVNQVISRIGVPWYNVLGNHDMNYDVAGDEGANQTFESKFGPTTYSFNYGQVHFIVLDDIVYKGFNPTQTGYVGGFTPDQLEFLKNDLSYVSKDKLIVLMMHIPLFSENWNSKSFRQDDRQALFELLKDFPHTLSISGHTHIQRHYFFKKEEGWNGTGEHHHYNAGTACGSWWSGEPDEFGLPHTTMRDGTPNGYAYVRFNGNQFVLDYKAARKPADYQMSVYAPRSLRKGEFPTSKLYVNFFMGNERTKVLARINYGDDWQVMEKTLWPDPFMSALMVRYDDAPHPLTGPRLSAPSSCNHLWQMPVPTHLPLGTHTIDIKVIDMWGREFTSSTSFRME